jgi:hypothetical protein
MPALARYAMQSDELGHLVTPTCSVSANANYPVANIATLEPDDVFLSAANGSSGIRFVWDHGSAKVVKLFSLHHHNLPAGTVCRAERNATDSWGGPTISQNFTIGAHPVAGLPRPHGVDLTVDAGYEGVTGLRYSSLWIPALSQLVGIGSALWWGAKREDITNVLYPAIDTESYPKRTFSTAYGKQKQYSLGVRLRSHPAVFRLRDSAWTPFQSLFLSCQGGSNRFLWWRDTTGSDAMLAMFDDDSLARTITYANVNDTQLTIVEVACGVAIPTV